jgi:hypothetical protein
MVAIDALKAWIWCSWTRGVPLLPSLLFLGFNGKPKGQHD